jgi:signal transduction histidine kinase
MDRWIQEMLEMARLAAGEMHPRPEDLPLRGVIIDMTQRLFFDQDLARIRVEVSEDASVRADPQHLERMLTNLLTNAFKYSPADGPVVIRAEPEGANVAIVVVDQGPGISMEDQARAFKRVFKGDGVGLYVTRVLAEAQGGSVSLRSTPGTRGSEFRVLLPMPKMPA